MSRWKAASIHVSISVMIGLLVFALLSLVWFPTPYFDAAGGQHLILILLAVDLVLGPLLTLVLFKSGKKGMLFDLWTIGIVQSTALVFGMYVIAQARPVFIVAAIDRFNVVLAVELDSADLADGQKPEFRSLSWTGPKLVAARLPVAGKDRTALLMSGMKGKDIEKYPKFYVDYDDEARNLLARAKRLESLRKRRPQAAYQLDRWLDKHSRKDMDVAWIPVVARESSLTMLLDSKTGAVLGALPIDPW